MVPISPQVYSAEAVVFDTKPLFDYAQRLDERRAKRALAEQEAVDNYLKDINKNLTPTGMRAQDVPKFLEMQKEFRGLSNQYKGTKDPYKRLELQKKGDEMFLYIQRSKQADELAKPTREALKNPENRKKLNTEKMMQDLAIHDMPLDFQGVSYLGIPARKDINPNASYYRETPFSFKENFDKAATGPGIKFSELTMTIGGKVNKIKEGFNKSTIEEISSNFADIVESDDDKKSYYTIKAKNLPAEELAKYGLKIKEYFPSINVDADLSDDPMLVARAEAIIAAEKRNADKFENAAKISVSTGGGGGGGGRTGRIDLTTYRDEGDSKDVTDIFQGVKVTGLPKGESMLAKKVLYNKDKNEVTVTEWIGRDTEGNPTGQQTRTIPYDVFLQNIKTLNPQTDFRYIETLPSAKTGKAPATITMKESDYRKLTVAQRQEFRNKGGVIVK
jgi:hypothetical protein